MQIICKSSLLIFIKIAFAHTRAHFETCFIELATKRLRILSIPPNDKIRNRLVANPILTRSISQYHRKISLSSDLVHPLL